MLPEAAESPGGSGANLPDWSSVLEKTKIKTPDALLRLTPRTAPAEEALGGNRAEGGRAPLKISSRVTTVLIPPTTVAWKQFHPGSHNDGKKL